MTDEQKILEGLTEAQKQAVTHIDGPMLVLAGPGSGKTRVITHRVAYLIHKAAAPWNILALTFTNKAAQEMRERLVNLNVPRGSTICTFHSLAARLLREFAQEVGLPSNFSIYDTTDQKAAVKQALKNCELDTQSFTPASMLSAISNYKNDIKTPEDIEAISHDFFTKVKVKVYKAYQAILETNGALDFDDLIMKLALLLRDAPHVRKLLNQRYRYVLVDEYQDTNHCQYQIARGLALDHNNLFVTGDPDQSIYGWRGADIGNIMAFEDDYPHARVVRLEENFRSVPEILKIADDLIKHNKQRKKKRLFTNRSGGVSPELIECSNEYDEALNAAQWITQLHNEGYNYNDIAVFYRINAMSRVIEQTLRDSAIPYQIVRGLEFFKRREIKDMIAYMRLLINPADEVSLLRVINRPARGIGATTLHKLSAYAKAKGFDLWQAINEVQNIDTISAGIKSRVNNFVNLIKTLQGNLDKKVSDIIRITYQLSGMKALLAKEPTTDQHDNVTELINSAVQYEQQYEPLKQPQAEKPQEPPQNTQHNTNIQYDITHDIQQKNTSVLQDNSSEKQTQGHIQTAEPAAPPENLDAPSLAGYLQDIALVSDADGYDNSTGSVSLMSLHAAKGLEFPAVLIIGVEDGIIPHIRSAYEKKDLEEERRLLFVGITRAKEKLRISYARRRTVQGMTQAAIASGFLRQLRGLKTIISEGLYNDDDSYDDNNNYGNRYNSRNKYKKRNSYGSNRYNRSYGKKTAANKHNNYDNFDIDDSYNIDDTEPGQGNEITFEKGQLVRHPRFGLGRILKYVPDNDKSYVILQLNSGVRKKLFLKYARLEKI